MIELTEQQIQAIDNREAGPPEVVNPRTKKSFVLVPVEEYRRLKEDYDDSPWTSEEHMTLAWEAGKRAGWDDMDEYDEIPDKP